jgi:hypothetical protein
MRAPRTKSQRCDVGGEASVPLQMLVRPTCMRAGLRNRFPCSDSAGLGHLCRVSAVQRATPWMGHGQCGSSSANSSGTRDSKKAASTVTRSSGPTIPPPLPTGRPNGPADQADQSGRPRSCLLARCRSHRAAMRERVWSIGDENRQLRTRGVLQVVGHASEYGQLVVPHLRLRQAGLSDDDLEARSQLRGPLAYRE